MIARMSQRLSRCTPLAVGALVASCGILLADGEKSRSGSGALPQVRMVNKELAAGWKAKDLVPSR